MNRVVEGIARQVPPPRPWASTTVVTVLTAVSVHRSSFALLSDQYASVKTPVAARANKTLLLLLERRNFHVPFVRENRLYGALEEPL